MFLLVQRFGSVVPFFPFFSNRAYKHRISDGIHSLGLKVFGHGPVEEISDHVELDILNSLWGRSVCSVGLFPVFGGAQL